MNVILRLAVEADCEFAFEAKRQALGPHVAAHWGWDESTQLAYHHQHWTSRLWSIILNADGPIGTVSIETTKEYIRFGEFYLLTRYQRQGIGSQILKEVLHIADAQRLPTKLEYLKWNPVGSLYKRHGFVVVDENDTHYFLLREPAGTRS